MKEMECVRVIPHLWRSSHGVKEAPIFGSYVIISHHGEYGVGVGDKTCLVDLPALFGMRGFLHYILLQ
jgi:hypothetical protein